MRLKLNTGEMVHVLGRRGERVLIEHDEARFDRGEFRVDRALVLEDELAATKAEIDSAASAGEDKEALLEELAKTKVLLEQTRIALKKARGRQGL